MSWASEEHEDAMAIAAEEYKRDQENRDGALELFQKLDTLPDITFLDYVLMNGEKDSMNQVVHGGAFPAYDIAYKLRDENRRPSPKQRKAIANVFVFDGFGYKRDQLEEDE